jgi:predicted phosphodiesterase
MTRLLAFSDIHGSVPAVEALVATERGGFDGVVIAGDIGDRPQALFRALKPLNCPVLYVYGNWDYSLDYAENFGPHCYHLHGSIVNLGDLAFVGFSGCNVGWGRNPLWEAANAELQIKHHPICNRLTEAKAADEAHSNALAAACESEVAELTRRVRDRRKRSFKKRVTDLRRKYARRRAKECRKAQDVRESHPYQEYAGACGVALSETWIRNRTEVIERIRSLEGMVSRTVLMTHERVYRLPEDVPGLGCHLFGHRHGFKVTTQRGTTFVNVSSLDAMQQIEAQYGIIEWTPSVGFRVTGKSLPPSKELFSRCFRLRVLHGDH